MLPQDQIDKIYDLYDKAKKIKPLPESEQEQYDTYDTSDLALASFLFLKHPMERMDKSTPGRCFFFFEDCEELRNDIDDYNHSTASVDPKRYFQSIRDLKAQIYNQ